MRIILDILLAASIFFAPIWVTLILAVTAFFLFNNFYELIIAGLLVDLMYGAPEARYGGFLFVTFISSIVLFFILTITKKRLLIFAK